MTPADLQRTYESAVGHHRAGRLAEAESLYRQVLDQAPHTPEALTLLAGILEDTGRAAEAALVYRQVTALRPEDADAFVSLGNALRQTGDLEGAIAAYRKAIGIQPNYEGALNNLANALWDSGDLEEALGHLRHAASIGTDPATASNLLFALHFDPDVTPAQLRAEHDAWNQRYARPLFAPIVHPNRPDPDRRLRIGYVSPDLCNHPVGVFMLPILANRDRARFQIVCYSGARPDGLTQRLASLSDLWRDVRPFSDADLAEQIRKDQIDILVDLTLHSRGSRLLAFAPKPAPVQVSYLGYCSTTGLDAMDYRLSDPWLDPIDSDPKHFSEATIRLPKTYWCYQPLFDVPEPGPLPALSNGFVTFGCLNNFYKIRPPVLDAWQRVLAGLPGSRLILHAHSGSHRERVRDRFKVAGIAPERIEFIGAQSLAKYFDAYQRIDIALDPFPFPGATTTLDALWSGVPVVTLAGLTAVSRAGASILSNVGMSELITHDPENYVVVAQELAKDVARLSLIRSSLRRRMRSSPLTDTAGSVRGLESAFRQMWAQWCVSPPNIDV